MDKIGASQVFLLEDSDRKTISKISGPNIPRSASRHIAQNYKPLIQFTPEVAPCSIAFNRYSQEHHPIKSRRLETTATMNLLITPSPDRSSNGINVKPENKTKKSLKYASAEALETPCIKAGKIKETTSEVKQPVNMSRAQVGGKGMYLHCMKASGLRVPRFDCITSNLMARLEQQIFDSKNAGLVEKLQKYCPDLLSPEQQDNTKFSLEFLKEQLLARQPQQMQQCLQILSDFIASDVFYEQLKNRKEAEEIRSIYLQLFPDSASEQRITPVIVRSSGIAEDDFGDAQAGKYKSEVHNGGDILRTCLKVMSSGYRPQVCPNHVPQPMALIIQECIHCQYGGVLISYSSLTDDTIRIEYVPGQAKGAVAGEYGITPHRFELTRNEFRFKNSFTPGSFSTQFVLVSCGSGFKEIETSLQQSSPFAREPKLSGENLEQLYVAVIQQENILQCPVDLEFGVDMTGQLYLFQVRPVTRLSGAMSFTMALPAAIFQGQPVSEGVSCGEPIYCNTEFVPTIDLLPCGAIIFAPHFEEWMLKDQVLKRLGGLVFDRGGINDHVAITLRQAGKPLLIGEGAYAVADKKSKITLVCGQFNESPGGFLLDGDVTDKLKQHMELSVSQTFQTLLSQEAGQPSEPPDIRSPDVGFAWLNRQNTLLLNYFRNGGLLNQCLSHNHSLQLSMNRQRDEMMKKLAKEIGRMLNDAENFVHAYGQFLNLATHQNHNLAALSTGRGGPELLDSFEQLKALKKKVLVLNQQAEEKVLVICRQFSKPGQASRTLALSEWLTLCAELLTFLQSLDQPETVEKIRSIHDLIFWVHKEFIRLLAPISIASGLGDIKKYEYLTLINFTNDASGLLNQACEESLNKLDAPTVTVCINMGDTVFVNTELGIHVCTIEMLEQADGGKQRTLRFKLTDHLERTQGGSLKRFWFIPQLLRAMNFGKNSGGMNTQLNKVEDFGELMIECNFYKSRDAMQVDFTKLISVLVNSIHFNFSVDNRSIYRHPQSWSFPILKNKLKNEILDSQEQDYAFKHCLLIHAEQAVVNRRFDSMLLKEKYRGFNCDYLSCFSKKNQMARNVNLVRNLGDDTRWEILHHYLQYLCEIHHSTDLGSASYAPLEKKHLLELVNKNGCLLGLIPPNYVDVEIISKAIENNGMALQFIDTTLRNRNKIVLSAVSQNGLALEFVSGNLKNNYKIAITAVSQNGLALEFVGDALRNRAESSCLPVVNKSHRGNELTANIVITAIYENGCALEYVGRELQSNIEFVELCIDYSFGASFAYAADEIRNNPSYVMQLFNKYGDGSYSYVRDIIKCSGKDIRNDPEVIRKAIDIDSSLFEYASKNLQDDFQFILSNFSWENSDILEYATIRLKQNQEFVIKMIQKAAIAFKYADETIRNQREFVLIAINNNLSLPQQLKKGLSIFITLEHVSKKLQKDRDIVMADICKNGGLSLEFASPELKKDRDIVLAAVRFEDTGWAITYADEEIMLNQEIALTALSNWGHKSVKSDYLESDLLEKGREFLNKYNEAHNTSLSMEYFNLVSSRQKTQPIE